MKMRLLISLVVALAAIIFVFSITPSFAQVPGPVETPAPPAPVLTPPPPAGTITTPAGVQYVPQAQPPTQVVRHEYYATYVPSEPAIRKVVDELMRADGKVPAGYEKILESVAGKGKLVRGYPDGSMGWTRPMKRWEVALVVERAARENAAAFKAIDEKVSALDKKVDLIGQSVEGHGQDIRLALSRTDSLQRQIIAVAVWTLVLTALVIWLVALSRPRRTVGRPAQPAPAP